MGTLNSHEHLKPSLMQKAYLIPRNFRKPLINI